MQQAGHAAELDRRAVLAGVGAAVIAGARPARNLYAFEVGVQLWTVDALLREDLDAGLAAVRGLGVTAVETAGLHGRSAEDFAAALRRAGLTCIACHVPQTALGGDLQRQLDDAAALGARYLVCASPQPSRPVRAGADWAQGLAEAMTPADWLVTAEVMNRAGTVCARQGMRAAYHNHAFEFDRHEGRRAIDLLIEETEPGLVDFELDVGWAFAAGVDPVEALRTLGGRVRLLHLKDMRRDDIGVWRSGPVGGGGIDWWSVLAAVNGIGVVAAFVEQDPPFERPPLQELRASLAFLNAMSTAARSPG